ncbi:Initiation factor 2B-related like protein [Aduncisulcus paluster]|uniref:Translation initiation factor eIF2B subunit delta n=1 Tax=Aduncisulcus paluster TaxID=2918883 RepID=A0ABQ5JS78_9EUKA|nr:Initiation factor 2B-related like protein [Aduncisulcus paluster]
MRNGTIIAKAGTRLITELAQAKGIPTVVVCESKYFLPKMTEECKEHGDKSILKKIPDRLRLDVICDPSSPDLVQECQETKFLHIESYKYDSTPASYIDMIICEKGKTSPSAVAMFVAPEEEEEEEVYVYRNEEEEEEEEQ